MRLKSLCIIKIVLFLVVLFIGISGCVQSDTKTSVPLHNEIVVTDSDGNVLTFDSPPQRIVITGGNIAEVLIMIGASDQIVGVGESVKTDPRLSKYLNNAESIGDYSVPNYEKIISLNPDLLLCYSSDKPKNLDLLRKVSVPIGFFDCYKQNKLSEEVRNLGVLTGNEKKANNLSIFIDSVHALIKEKITDIPEDNRPNVYYETGTDFTAAASNSGGDWLITTSGGKNIANNASMQWVKVTPEWIILQNPDVIIKPGNDDNETSLDQTWKSITTRSGFNELKAIQENRTYILSHDILYGPQSVIGLVYIAKILYPELFNHMDPKSFLDQFSADFFPEANHPRVIFPNI
ncbi:ABC transporter substrate-binding protein [Methanospirillum sp.]|uniref:ABC transporter substrate-binding protein n=1 Tax=Methanospirillum sp. TaxID=45200 RepID=UPI0035A0042C